MAAEPTITVPATHDPQLSAEPLPEAVRAVSETLTVAGRQRLAAQGDVPRYMYCVVSGEVRLVRVGKNGEMFILQRVRCGWVAEASLFARRYHCDLETAGGTILVRVPVKAVRTALDASPEFRRYWVECLSGEIRRLRGACERIGLRRAEQRVLHAIESEGSDGVLRPGGALKDWAGELGLTHEALYRALARLECAGVVRRENGALVLVAESGKRATP
jgi:CRP/FNR family transcriptional regulator, dissimilatory nitrate respiration regulator